MCNPDLENIELVKANWFSSVYTTVCTNKHQVREWSHDGSCKHTTKAKGSSGYSERVAVTLSRF